METALQHGEEPVRSVAEYVTKPVGTSHDETGEQRAAARARCSQYKVARKHYIRIEGHPIRGCASHDGVGGWKLHTCGMERANFARTLAQQHRTA